MTAGPTTALPKPGDILHYVYLFGHEQDRGRDEGIKARPVMVAAVQGTTVFTIAITSKGERYAGSMKFPDDVAQKAGLRAGSAAVIAEYNYFTWLGYDIRPVLSAPGYVAGRVPPGFADVLIEKLLGASPRAIARD